LKTPWAFVVANLAIRHGSGEGVQGPAAGADDKLANAIRFRRAGVILRREPLVEVVVSDERDIHP
jgi:hypothetical protein